MLSPEVTKLFHTVQGQRAARVAGDRRGRAGGEVWARILSPTAKGDDYEVRPVSAGNQSPPFERSVVSGIESKVFDQSDRPNPNQTARCTRYTLGAVISSTNHSTESQGEMSSRTLSSRELEAETHTCTGTLSLNLHISST